MAKEKYLSKGGHTYKHKGWITKPRKELIEKHPHAASHFLFKQSHMGFNWYVRV